MKEAGDSINGEIEIKKAKRRRAAAVAGGDSDNVAEGGKTGGTPLICRCNHGIRDSTVVLGQLGGVSRTAAAT